VKKAAAKKAALEADTGTAAPDPSTLSTPAAGDERNPTGADGRSDSS
jgi:hypothetical protein